MAKYGWGWFWFGEPHALTREKADCSADEPRALGLECTRTKIKRSKCLCPRPVFLTPMNVPTRKAKEAKEVHRGRDRCRTLGELKTRFRVAAMFLGASVPCVVELQ